MRYLLQVGIDKAFILRRNVHYFRFDGVAFKLIQHPERGHRRWSDALVAIVDGWDGPEAQRALTAAGNWASALAWETRRPISVHVLGGGSWPRGRTLRSARCNIFVPPRLASLGMMRGVELYRVAHTVSDEQRLAMTIFREAQASNNVLLSILLYWQVLEVDRLNPVGWINKLVARRELPHMARTHLGDLNLGSRRLGEYLLDDCRHAIAHFKRKPGKTRILLDNLRDTIRLGASGVVLESLARTFIERVLGVSGSLWLARPRSGGFPEYVVESELAARRLRLVRQT